MSVDPSDATFEDFAARVSDALVSSGRLTPENIKYIQESMRAGGLGFGDAAIHLGLISREDLVEAIESARRSRPRDGEGGVVETALLSLSAASRRLPVKYSKVVKPARSLILANQPETAYGEQIRTLRTELQLLNGSFGGHSITVLSPCEGEGRTKLCAELAVAYSQLGKRTLLVDGDLRRSGVHSLFDFDNSFGLGQALTAGGNPELLAVEKLPYLSVLAAGPTTANPLELLSNGHLARMMSGWRKKYEMVIIDTPPISLYADGLAIASISEQVLVVSRTNRTPHKHLREMFRRLASSQSRVVGAVLNKF